MKMASENNFMRKIEIEKITLNVGVGKDEETMKKGLKLLQKLTPFQPVKTVSKKRIPSWGLRPGLPIGCKVTIRKGRMELLRRLLAAKENTLKIRNFDKQGNFSFGIPEYIDIEGLNYDPELKIMGLEVAVTLKRPGFNVIKKKIGAKIGKAHKITPKEAIVYVKSLGVEVI